MLAGCVQPAMMPNINTATARVLNAAGIQTVIAPKAGCCGAVKFHLNDQDGGMAEMRANIDAWWPLVEAGVEAIVMNASGCGVTVKEYGHILQHDAAVRGQGRAHQRTHARPERAAARVGAGAETPSSPSNPMPRQVIGFHPPARCSTASSSRAVWSSTWPRWASRCRWRSNEAHLCCGSAGTYSVLNPTLSYQLRDRKLGHLSELQPDVITSANIGCITHLQSGTQTPVRHWVEILDDALNP